MTEVTTTPEPISVTSIEELVQLLDLTDVRCYKLHAESSDTDTDTGEDDVETVDFEFRTAIRRHETGVDFRIAVRAKRPNGKVRVDVAALYAAPGPFIVSDDLIASYGENVAAMTVLPYIRQHLSDITQRVGSHFLLPIVPRGLIRFSAPGDSASAGEPSRDAD